MVPCSTREYSVPARRAYTHCPCPYRTAPTVAAVPQSALGLPRRAAAAPPQHTHGRERACATHARVAAHTRSTAACVGVPVQMSEERNGGGPWMHIGLAVTPCSKLHESKKTPETAPLEPTRAVHFDGQPAMSTVHVLQVIPIVQVLKTADVLM